jgi:hypothetical protein
MMGYPAQARPAAEEAGSGVLSREGLGDVFFVGIRPVMSLGNDDR